MEMKWQNFFRYFISSWHVESDDKILEFKNKEWSCNGAITIQVSLLRQIKIIKTSEIILVWLINIKLELNMHQERMRNPKD